MRKIPRELWPTSIYDRSRTEVWRDLDFLAQVFEERDGAQRVSINRVRHVNSRWVDGITWEDLMFVKRGIGRGDLWAVEVFPPDDEVVNDANMRHLWLLPDPPKFAWRKT